MVEKIEKVVNHRAVVFDTEKFEMLKNSIEKIMNDKMTITLKEIEGVIVLNNTNTTNLRFSRPGDIVRITKKEYEFDDKIKIGFVIEPEQLSL